MWAGSSSPTERRAAIAALALLLALWAPPATAQRADVDMALVLAVDGSASVDFQEFVLQMNGIAAAFRDPAVVAAVAGGPRGRIAVALMVWSGLDNPVGGVGWHVVEDAASATRFSEAARRLQRPVRPGATAINFAIRSAVDMMEASGFDADRRVVDLSGDGRENNVLDALAATDAGRREAVALGVTVNGLPILTDDPDLERYFLENVVGGPGAFMIAARNYDDFARAMREKLLREIEGELLIGALSEAQE